MARWGGRGGPPAAAQGMGRRRSPADEAAADNAAVAGEGGARPRAADEAVPAAARNDAFTDKAAKLPCGGSLRTRLRRRGGKGRASPDVRPCNFRRSGRRPPWAEAERTVARHVAVEGVGGNGEARRERGPAGRGRGRGTGGGETSPSADKTRARPPCPLPRPDRTALISRRVGTGRQPLHRPSGGPKWCRSLVLAVFRHGRE